jgi:hypothetical protein
MTPNDFALIAASLFVAAVLAHSLWRMDREDRRYWQQLDADSARRSEQVAG